MAFVHSKSSRVFVNDLNASCKLAGFTASHSRNYGDSTALCDSGQKGIPGLLEGTVSLDALFEQDSTVGGGSSWEVFKNARQAGDNNLLVTAMPSGLTVGAPAFITQSDMSGFEVESQVADTTKMSVEGTADNGVDWGVLLNDTTAITATGNASSVDNAASSANGGVASLHVSAVSGTSPTATIKVQHSTDNSVWTDLITFTAATAKTWEFKTVSGTVNRYVRAQYTIGGTTPSFTFAVAFARR